MKNQLIFGDNLDVLKSKIISDESIDLIYLDPPFNSKKTYNIIYKSPSNSKSENTQVEAFSDTWSWGEDDEQVLSELGALEDKNIYNILHSFRSFMGESDMMAYLTNMAIRIYFLKKKLKDSGSIFLHCDTTASHYLKIILDNIFGNQNFINEIVWKRTTAHSDGKKFGRIHDIILYYTKNNKKNKWNKTYKPYDPKYVEDFYKYEDKNGKYMADNATASGLEGGGYEYEWKGHTRIWRYPLTKMKALDKENKIHYTSTGMARVKRYLDSAKGVPDQDIFDDILAIGSRSKERLGYPTQKPLKLLEKIILSSTNEGDVVLDPFCGCGTTIIAAESLKRNWVGIDITNLAIGLVERRLRNSFKKVNFKSNGIPKSLSQAFKLRDLSEKNPKLYWEFQYWANNLIPGVINNSTRGSDGGVDGTFWIVADKKKNQFIFDKGIVSIKSGANISVAMVDSLFGSMKKNKAKCGLLVTLEKPKSTMIKAAAQMGVNIYFGKKYPKVECISVEELLKGVRPKTPISVHFETPDATQISNQASLFG